MFRNKTVAKCPKCGEIYVACLEFEYTGKCRPLIVCVPCKRAMRMPVQSAMTNKIKEPIRLVNVRRSRGLSRKQKKKMDIKLEIEARKLRKRLGVNAPSNWWFVPDSYNGEYGGV